MCHRFDFCLTLKLYSLCHTFDYLFSSNASFCNLDAHHLLDDFFFFTLGCLYRSKYIVKRIRWLFSDSSFCLLHIYLWIHALPLQNHKKHWLLICMKSIKTLKSEQPLILWVSEGQIPWGWRNVIPFNAVWDGMGPEVDHLYRSCDMWVILGPAQQITRIKHSLIGSLTHWFMGAERQHDFHGYTYSRDILHGIKWLATFNLTMTQLRRQSSKRIKWFL